MSVITGTNWNAYDAATNTMFVPCRDGGIQEVNLTTNTAGRLLAGENSGPILVGGNLWASGYPTGSLSEYDSITGRVLQNFFVGSGVPAFASPSAALGLLLIGTTSGVTAFKGPGGLPPDAPAHRAGRASKARQPGKHP